MARKRIHKRKRTITSPPTPKQRKARRRNWALKVVRGAIGQVKGVAFIWVPGDPEIKRRCMAAMDELEALVEALEEVRN
jgi:hypothetical protein